MLAHDRSKALMRAFTCIFTEHDPIFILLAALMCVVGCLVSTRLLRRMLATSGLPRMGWVFLGAVCTGSAIWGTHFIAILGYEPGVAVSFDPVLTMVSVLIAVGGVGVAFPLAAVASPMLASILGGGMMGVAIAAMHYTGMFAYRPEGLVRWSQGYITVSLALSVLLSIATVAAARRWSSGGMAYVSTALLGAAILALHFTGMAAFSVEPVGLALGVGHAAAFGAMALSVLIASLIVIGTGISSYLIDDRMRATSTEQLRRMAFHDPLTGLANRRGLQARMERSFSAEEPFQLLLVDLDRFKTVNDVYGHATGDHLLVEVAARIRREVDGDGFAARIGGDELAVLISGDGDLAMAIADRIVDALSAPFKIEEFVVAIGASIGVCCNDDRGERGGAVDAETMMQRADMALYEAKRRGRGQVFAYEHGMLERAADGLRLEEDLKLAVSQHGFHLVYQPVIDLQTNVTLGYEALIRWSHPTRGLISPATFIPVAEKNGSIIAIGAWVLEEACRQAMKWDGGQYVAVNVSAVQFESPLLLSQITNALSASGLPPSRLEIELTETAMVADAPHVAETLTLLRTLGIKVAMDDFGTGYSSLAHLKDLPLDRIKIDRSFVSAAAVDAKAMAVLRAIAQIGRDMGIQTLGEGVETDDQKQILSDLGCDAVQGYLTGRPMPAEATVVSRPAHAAASAA